MAINSFILWNTALRKMGARRCWLEAKSSSLHNFTAARSSALDFQYKKVVVVVGGGACHEALHLQCAHRAQSLPQQQINTTKDWKGKKKKSGSESGRTGCNEEVHCG